MLATVGLLTLSPAGCGEGEQRERPDPFAEAKRRVLTLGAGGAASPRWEQVARLEGGHNRTADLEVARGAIQWRVRWRCSAGRFALAVGSRGRVAAARAEGSCPRQGTTSSVETGAVRVTVAATARWNAVVEQQVETALHEPALPAMRSPAARVLARGRFYAIQQNLPGRGAVRLYRLPNGRLALRLDGFRTSASTDLFVRLSESRKSRTTRQSAGTPELKLARLKSTAGDQNYLLPRRIDRDAVGAVVIWDEAVETAYTAATLR